MSAPAVERPRTARPAARQPIARRSTGAPAPRDAGGAVGRAYARRAVREQRQSGEANAAAAGRSQFVLLIMVLFGVGLVASLWLSTTAAADSYRLDAARQATRDLSERSESLRTEIATMQSAPTLAQAAQQMGMVQVSDVARLVVAPDGSVAVVGTPKAAVAPYVPPPVLAPAPPVPGQPVDPAQGQPVDPAQAAAEGQPADQGQQSEQPADAAGADGQGTPGQPQVPAVQGPAAESGPQLAVTQPSAGTRQSSGSQPAAGSQQAAATRQTPRQFAAAAQAQQQTTQQQTTQQPSVQQRTAGAPTRPATGPGH
jgi:cell division protein FtsI (penicillin-binding protein 3)